MARKTSTVEVPEFEGNHNRDIGKLFLLTEWPAAQAEKWGIKAMLAYSRGNDARIPIDGRERGIGIEGIAALGINTFFSGQVKSDEVIPLLDELLTCVQTIRDKSRPDIATPFTDSDTDEVVTRLWLRSEVLSLHINFSVSAALIALWRRIMEMPVPTPLSSTTPSPDQI